MKKFLLIGAVGILGSFSLLGSSAQLETPQSAGVINAPVFSEARTFENQSPVGEEILRQDSVKEIEDSAQETNLSNDNYYTNTAGTEVHSPAYSTDDSIPSGASARCRDGTYSFSQNRRGTCSHHGGVQRWL